MAIEDPQIPFSDVLNTLRTADEVPIDLLSRLSDMSDEDMRAFSERWPSSPTERRREIAKHLVDLSEEDFVVDLQPVFAFCLDDADANVRIFGLEGLWDSTDLALIEPIIALLNEDPALEVRAAAAGSLAHFLLMSAWGQLSNVPTALIYEALIAAYRDPHADLLLRRVALESLGSVDSPEVSRAIEESYEGRYHELRLSALFAMGSSANPRWLPILLDETESPYEEMRQEAARALGSIGDASAVPRLAELVYDDGEGVAEAAIVALGEIGGDQALEMLEQMFADEDLEHLETFIEDALEESSWSTLDLQYGFFPDDLMDEEE